jgi:hypothetical protein
LSFLEDFEGFGLGGFNPELKPDQDWYDYSESEDIGEVSTEAPTMSDTQWLRVEAAAGTAINRRINFDLAAPTQLTNFTFEVAGVTFDDDGAGSRQFIAIQSEAPRRTMVEFYVFCTDAAEPTGCEFKVRFEGIDTTGQTLINTTLGISSFTVTVRPDWTSGQYRLIVNGVDDGLFPFLELPSTIGRLRIGQASNFYPLNMSLDNWFIDGAAATPAAISGDIARGLQNFATDIRFTTTTSLFMFGIVVLGILIFAVLTPLLSLGKDNTIMPALSFFAALCILWLILMEWWPDWVGIALIIIVAALIALVVRRRLMGIRDASTNAGLVAGALGYFIIATSLLGFSGYATDEITLPTSSLDTPEDANETAEKQTFIGGVAECLITFFSDCSRETVSTTWSTITNIASAIFNFARTAFTFLFQLLSFSLPIPVIFNVMLVFPPAAALATVGFGFITRSGS